MNTTLPPVFLSHGSPMTAMQPGEVGPFWQRLGPALDALSGRPRAILAVSAHSLSREPVLLAAQKQPTVHDFGGFPDALYRLNYDSAGAPALAERVAGLLKSAGLPIHVVDEGGLDHGIWSPLRFTYPEADIPVLPLAFPPNWSPAQLFALGEALAPLADEGVWIMATGSITHNLRLLGGVTRPSIESPEMPASAAFRSWFETRSAALDWPALLDYRAQAPNAVLMHPTDEHLLPWYVAAGAGGKAAAPLRVHDSITYGCLGMDAYAFGSAAPALAAELSEAALPG